MLAGIRVDSIDFAQVIHYFQQIERKARKRKPHV
jgi:hypothetical protein